MIGTVVGMFGLNPMELLILGGICFLAFAAVITAIRVPPACSRPGRAGFATVTGVVRLPVVDRNISAVVSAAVSNTSTNASAPRLLMSGPPKEGPAWAAPARVRRL